MGTHGVIGEIASARTAPAPFVPHSSTGAGKATMSLASPSYRHAPTDYNACKSFTPLEDELSYFQQAKQSFDPHSSTGASRNTDMISRYAPTDYNSSKSFSSHEKEVLYQDVRMNHSSTIDAQTPNVHIDRFTDLNSKAAPFVPHSSTGAGGSLMSAASPSFRTERR